MGLLRPGRPLRSLLSGIRRGRAAVSFVLPPSDGPPPSAAGQAGTAGGDLPGVHALRHCAGTGHQLFAGGPYRQLALADLPGLCLELPGPHRSLPFCPFRTGRTAVPLHSPAPFRTHGRRTAASAAPGLLLVAGSPVCRRLRRHLDPAAAALSKGKSVPGFRPGRLFFSSRGCCCSRHCSRSRCCSRSCSCSRCRCCCRSSTRQ